MNKLVERLKHFLWETYVFVSSALFLKNAGVAFAVVLAFLVCFFQLLKLYTHHGSSKEVPNLVGLTTTQAKKKKGYQYIRIIVSDSTYIADKAPLTILSQDPPAGARIKKNRKVYVTVNKEQPPLRNLPNIWGKDFEFELTRLASLRFKGVVSEERRPDKAEGTILEVRYKGKVLDPKKSHKLPEGSVLELIVAEGLGNQIGVPDLVCLPYDQALTIIRGSGLTLGMVSAIGVQDTFNAYVIQQYPEFFSGEMINRGESIDLWLGLSPLSRCQIDSTFINDDDGYDDEYDPDF